MRRRRLVTMIGLTMASGGLIVACAGAPKVALPTTPTSFGFGMLPVQIPSLEAPAIGPIQLDKPLVNQQAPVNAAASATINAASTDQAQSSVETGAYATGGCEFGH